MTQIIQFDEQCGFRGSCKSGSLNASYTLECLHYVGEYFLSKDFK